MQFHSDPVVEAAILGLLDALSSLERTAGHETLFVFVPIESGEKVLMASSGKLIPGKLLYKELIVENLSRALEAHEDPDVHRFIDGP